MPILEVKNLSVSFQQYTSGLKQKTTQVISSLDVELEAGEILAVVGASGSGKSLLAHAILGILPENASVSGTIKYDGELLTQAKQEALRGDKIALIPQSVNFLDPLMRVGNQVRTAVKKADPLAAQRDAFKRLHLEEQVEKLYPFQLSGGMARRTLLATAMVTDATVIIADEPTPGLDPLVMTEALADFRRFADQGSAVMLITHDIGAALTIADKIAVFYAGTTVEIASVTDFKDEGERLRHPYTKALWRALPQNEFIPLSGAQPYADGLPSGCLFAPRCDLVTATCTHTQPEMRELRDGKVRCFYDT